MIRVQQDGRTHPCPITGCVMVHGALPCFALWSQVVRAPIKPKIQQLVDDDPRYVTRSGRECVLVLVLGRTVNSCRGLVVFFVLGLRLVCFPFRLGVSEDCVSVHDPLA